VAEAFMLAKKAGVDPQWKSASNAIAVERLFAYKAAGDVYSRRMTRPAPVRMNVSWSLTSMPLTRT
jgi:3-hydroxyisobutyrate dehydrogenase-like beta-hydroxyacid dehydrogenase